MEPAWILPRIEPDQVLVARDPLPKMRPVEGAWLRRDAAFAAQMAERDRLIATRPGDVLACLPEGEAMVRECLELILLALDDDAGYRKADGSVTRPDGVTIAIDRTAPLQTLGRLVAEDLCLLEPGQGMPRLVAASLCFPAGWTLAQKIGHGMDRIHAPVPKYDDDIGRRVARFFMGLREGRPIWRANLHGYNGTALFFPQLETDPKEKVTDSPRFWRSERQTLLRLPKTGGVLFAINTTIARSI